MKSSTPESSQKINGPVLGEKVSPASPTSSPPDWKPLKDSVNQGIQVDQNGKFRTSIPENNGR